MPVWKSKTQGINLKQVTLCLWPGCIFESTRRKEAEHWNAGVLYCYKCRLDTFNVSLLIYTVFMGFSGLMGSHVQGLRIKGQVAQLWWCFLTQNNPQGDGIPFHSPLLLLVYSIRGFLSQHFVIIIIPFPIACFTNLQDLLPSNKWL